VRDLLDGQELFILCRPGGSRWTQNLAQEVSWYSVRTEFSLKQFYLQYAPQKIVFVFVQVKLLLS
jgi:hypothetical protein